MPLAQLADVLPGWMWYALMVVGLAAPAIGSAKYVYAWRAVPHTGLVTAYYLIALPLAAFVLSGSESLLSVCLFFLLMPFGFLLGMFLLLVAAPRSVERGICATCGYDLRATPDRCPECGTVPENSDEVDAGLPRGLTHRLPVGRNATAGEEARVVVGIEKLLGRRAPRDEAVWGSDPLARRVGRVLSRAITADLGWPADRLDPRDDFRHLIYYDLTSMECAIRLNAEFKTSLDLNVLVPYSDGRTTLGEVVTAVAKLLSNGGSGDNSGARLDNERQ